MIWDTEGKADRLYQKGELERAAEMYRRAGKPLRAAAVYVELGHINEAVALLEGEGEHLEAGEILKRQGRLKEAIPRFEKARAFHLAAEAALGAGYTVRAALSFEKAGLFGRAADYYLKEARFEAADRCFEQEIRRLREEQGVGGQALEGDIRKISIRRAGILIRQERFRDAALLLRDLGEHGRAAELFEKAGLFDKAAAAYQALGQSHAALAALKRAEEVDDELLAEVSQACGQYEEAAEAFERLGRMEAAAVAWEAAGAWGKSAEFWEQLQAPDRAATLYVRSDRQEEAARCFFEAKNYAEAGTYWDNLGMFLQAGESWEKAERPFRAGRSYLAGGDETGALRMLLQVRQVEDKAGETEGSEETPKSNAFREYLEASMWLVPLLLEGAKDAEAEERLLLVRKYQAELPPLEIQYLDARLTEIYQRLAQAEELYFSLLSTQHDFRDAAERHKRLRRRRAVSGEGNTNPVELLGTEIALEEKAAPEIDTNVLRMELGVVFELGESFEPWWTGSLFFEGQRRADGKEVVLVIFPAGELGDRVVALRRTARQLTHLQNRSLLHLEEMVSIGEALVLVYERFSTRTLARDLGSNSFTMAQRHTVLIQVVSAMVAAHKLGITHQWLSPRTVLLDGERRVRVAGMGLHHVLGFGDDTSKVYLSPEVRQGLSVGPATDMFGIGLLAVTLFEPELPMNWEQMDRLKDQRLVWPEGMEEILSARERQMLLDCLRPDPTERPSAEQLLGGLSARGLVGGQILNDRYEIRGELGAGGMGRVYRALDLDLGGELALKTVLSPSGGRSEDEDRLLREVQICRKLTHHNIVRVHDMGRFPGGIFITMELLKGEGLDEVIEREGALDLGKIRYILLEICRALSEAHRSGVIHRDLKPGNVMLLVDERVKVLDFGIAREVEASTGHLTATGEVIGSPLYMSPEQIQGKKLGAASDLYALGVIAFTLLTGSEPFLGENSTEIVMKHLKEAPPDPGDHRKEPLPAAWSELVGRLLAKKATDRIESADALADLVARLPDH